MRNPLCSVVLEDKWTWLCLCFISLSISYFDHHWWTLSFRYWYIPLLSKIFNMLIWPNCDYYMLISFFNVLISWLILWCYHLQIIITLVCVSFSFSSKVLHISLHGKWFVNEVSVVITVNFFFITVNFVSEGQSFELGSA